MIRLHQVYAIVLASVIGLLIAIPVGSPVSAALHGSAMAASCAYLGAGWSDGCAYSNPSSTYQVTNFFTSYARQSSQTYASTGGNTSSAHPPPWDVAGVDYPVGYYTAKASLKDPAVTQPTNCTYHLTGSLFNSAFPYLECGTASGQNVDIEGYNFGPVGGHDCTPVTLSSANLTSGTTVTIKDNLFENGADCSNNATNNITGMIQTDITGYTIGSTINVQYNTWLGHWADPCCDQPPYSPRAMGFLTTGSLTFEYNAIVNWPSDPIFLGVGGGSNIGTVEYNYLEGWVYRGAESHGEWGSLSYGSGQSTVGSFLVAYNTLLSTTTQASNDTTLLWYSQGVASVVYTGTNMIANNVVVANYVGGVNTSGKVSFIVSDITETGPGNVVTITNPGTTHIAPGTALQATGITLYQYLGTDSSGRPQYSFDCAGVSSPTCPSVGYNPSVGPILTPMSEYASNSTGNADMLAQNSYDQTLFWKNNYLDPTGTGGGTIWAGGGICYGTPGSSFSGNVNMLTGATITGYSHNVSTGC